MVCIGVLCALAPRLGWDSSNYGLDHFALAFLVTFVVTGITFVRSGAVGSPDGGGGKRRKRSSCHRPAASGEGHMCEATVTQRKAEAGPAAAAAAAGTAQEVAVAAVDRPLSADEDPLWSADWTKPAQLPAEARPVQPAEVFELNDTPTWLARLQQRRHQAERAGKKKLVQKIDKEIAEAQKAHGAPVAATVDPAATAAAAAVDRASAPKSGGAGGKALEETASSLEDVWSMDWAALNPQGRQLPAVAAA